MIELYKNRSETPLEAITRLRKERPELESETLSYAGRLDPMAEGILPILVGSEENKNRADFLKKDKEYKVEFLLGCSTDTGDVLGIITNTKFDIKSEKEIKEAIESLKQITEQTYPWYSSKTVAGIPLFEYARNKDFSIERPRKDITIYSVSEIIIKSADSRTIFDDITRDIRLVQGDFRQIESLRSLYDAFREVPEELQIIECTLQVSSGTYIRGLVENISESLKIPVLVHKLVRTKIL